MNRRFITRRWCACGPEGRRRAAQAGVVSTVVNNSADTLQRARPRGNDGDAGHRRPAGQRRPARRSTRSAGRDGPLGRSSAGTQVVLRASCHDLRAPRISCCRPDGQRNRDGEMTRWDAFQDLRGAQDRISQMNQMNQMLAEAPITHILLSARVARADKSSRGRECKVDHLPRRVTRKEKSTTHPAASEVRKSTRKDLPLKVHLPAGAHRGTYGVKSISHLVVSPTAEPVHSSLYQPKGGAPWQPPLIDPRPSQSPARCAWQPRLWHSPAGRSSRCVESSSSAGDLVDRRARMAV